MSATSAPTSTTKAPKLRASCENCGTTKVRCDRSQPECRRCISLGLSCTYGISRKFGKPPRKRVRHSKDKNTSTLGGQQLQEINQPAQDKAFSSILPATSNTNTTSHQQSNLNSFEQLPIIWPQLEMWGADFDFASLSNNPSVYPTLEPTNNASASFDSPEFHSCPRGSYELFRDMICPAPFLHAPKASSDMVSAQLDQVLHFNRDAIDRLNRLLKCSCAKSGHRIMVNASIISRILIWYQQAAGLNVTPSHASSVPSSSQEERPGISTSKLAGLSQATGFAVDPSPILVGTFSIEDQNLQTAVRIQLVLSELKLAADVIQLFMTQESDTLHDYGVTSLYSHLGAWLQSELSRTVDTLKQRLSEVQN